MNSHQSRSRDRVKNQHDYFNVDLPRSEHAATSKSSQQRIDRLRIESTNPYVVKVTRTFAEPKGLGTRADYRSRDGSSQRPSTVNQPREGPQSSLIIPDDAIASSPPSFNLLFRNSNPYNDHRKLLAQNLDRTIQTEHPVKKGNDSMPNLDLYGLESAQYNFEDPRFDIAMFDDKNHKVEPLSTEKSVNTGQSGQFDMMQTGDSELVHRIQKVLSADNRTSNTESKTTIEKLQHIEDAKSKLRNIQIRQVQFPSTKVAASPTKTARPASAVKQRQVSKQRRLGASRQVAVKAKISATKMVSSQTETKQYQMSDTSSILEKGSISQFSQKKPGLIKISGKVSCGTSLNSQSLRQSTKGEHQTPYDDKRSMDTEFKKDARIVLKSSQIAFSDTYQIKTPTKKGRTPYTALQTTKKASLQSHQTPNMSLKAELLSSSLYSKDCQTDKQSPRESRISSPQRKPRNKSSPTRARARQMQQGKAESQYRQNWVNSEQVRRNPRVEDTPSRYGSAVAQAPSKRTTSKTKQKLACERMATPKRPAQKLPTQAALPVKRALSPQRSTPNKTPTVTPKRGSVYRIPQTVARSDSAAGRRARADRSFKKKDSVDPNKSDLKDTSFVVSPKDEKLPINLDLNSEFPININKQLLENNHRFDVISQTLKKMQQKQDLIVKKQESLIVKKQQSLIQKKNRPEANYIARLARESQTLAKKTSALGYISNNESPFKQPKSLGSPLKQPKQSVQEARVPKIVKRERIPSGVAAVIGRPYEEEEEEKVEEVQATKSPGLLKQRLDQLKVAQQNEYKRNISPKSGNDSFTRGRSNTQERVFEDSQQRRRRDRGMRGVGSEENNNSFEVHRRDSSVHRGDRESSLHNRDSTITFEGQNMKDTIGSKRASLQMMIEINDDMQRLDTFGKYDATVVDEANVLQQKPDFNPFKETSVPTIAIEAAIPSKNQQEANFYKPLELIKPERGPDRIQARTPNQKESSAFDWKGQSPKEKSGMPPPKASVDDRTIHISELGTPRLESQEDSPSAAQSSPAASPRLNYDLQPETTGPTRVPMHREQEEEIKIQLPPRAPFNYPLRQSNTVTSKSLQGTVSAGNRQSMQSRASSTCKSNLSGAQASEMSNNFKQLAKKSTFFTDEMNQTEQQYFGDRFPDQLNKNMHDPTRYYRRTAILSKRDTYIKWLCKLVTQTAKEKPIDASERKQTEDSKSQLNNEIATETESYDFKSASVSCIEMGDTGALYSAQLVVKQFPKCLEENSFECYSELSMIKNLQKIFDNGNAQQLAGSIIMPFDIVDSHSDTWIAYDYHPVGYSSHHLTMSLKDAMFHIYETDPAVDPDARKRDVSPKREEKLMNIKYIKHGKLFRAINTEKVTVVRQFFQKIVDVLLQLNEKGLYHGDLSLDNIEISFDESYKTITDVKLKCLQKRQEIYLEQIEQQPPEVIKMFANKTYTSSSVVDNKKKDIWQLGLLLVQIVSGFPVNGPQIEEGGDLKKFRVQTSHNKCRMGLGVFADVDVKSRDKTCFTRAPALLLQQTKFTKDVGRSLKKIEQYGLARETVLIELIEGMVQFDPEKRFSLQDVANHQFLQS